MNHVTKSFLTGVGVLLCGIGALGSVVPRVVAAPPVALLASQLSYEEAMQVLEAATPYFEDHYDVGFAYLVDAYHDATLTITQEGAGYRVKDGGTLGEVLILGLG